MNQGCEWRTFSLLRLILQCQPDVSVETRNAFDLPIFGHISKLYDLSDWSKEEVGAMTSLNYFNFWSLKEN